MARICISERLARKHAAETFVKCNARIEAASHSARVRGSQMHSRSSAALVGFLLMWAGCGGDDDVTNDGETKNDGGSGSAGSGGKKSAGSLPECSGSAPWLDLDNGCNYTFTMGGAELIRGECNFPMGVSSDEDDSELLLKGGTSDDASPFESFSLTMRSPSPWDELEGFDSTESAPATLLATIEYMRASSMPTRDNILLVTKEMGYLAVSSSDCFVNTDPAAAGEDPLQLRVASVKAICLDRFSGRTFYEVHGMVNGACAVKMGDTGEKQEADLELTF